MKPIDSKTPFVAVAESRIGGRQENQDTCAWQDTPHGLLLLVCDGMGGGPSGKYASQLAADVIVNYVLDSSQTADRRDILARAIREANKALIAAQEADPARRGMGTTVTALLINRDAAVVAHVGDSRVYQFRGAHKVFRTFDHSHVFELVKAKALTEEEARVSGESNIITRALGPMENVEPDIEILPYEKGDRFMLCTDGIWGAMPEKELVRIAGGTRSLSGAVESLAISVDETGRSHGNTHDNLTVAMLQTPFNSKLRPRMSTKVKYTLYALAVIAAVSILINILQYHRYNNITSAIAASQTADVKEKPEAGVTMAQLDSALQAEREKNRHESDYYQEQIDKLNKMLSERADDPAATPDRKEADKISAETKLIQEINSLISLVEKIGKMKSGKELDQAVANASNEMKDINSKVRKMNISDPEFDKCIENSWITNKITSTVGMKNREGHIAQIIKSLESLKKQIQNNKDK